jgi:hypothetical protein
MAQYQRIAGRGKFIFLRFWNIPHLISRILCMFQDHVDPLLGSTCSHSVGHWCCGTSIETFDKQQIQQRTSSIASMSAMASTCRFPAIPSEV